MSGYQMVLTAVVLLLAVGLYALLTVRNLVKLVIALQIMVKAVLLGFVLAGRLAGRPVLAQSLATTVLVADTLVAVIGLALAVQIQQRLGTLDVSELTRLKG